MNEYELSDDVTKAIDKLQKEVIKQYIMYFISIPCPEY